MTWSLRYYLLTNYEKCLRGKAAVTVVVHMFRAGYIDLKSQTLYLAACGYIADVSIHSDALLARLLSALFPAPLLISVRVHYPSLSAAPNAKRNHALGRQSSYGEKRRVHRRFPPFWYLEIDVVL